MTQYTIDKDKDKPPPNKRVYAGRPRKYPWGEMQIGDSFAIPCDTSDKESTYCIRNSVLSCARTYALRHNQNAKFTSRAANNEVRVWRIA